MGRGTEGAIYIYGNRDRDIHKDTDKERHLSTKF